VGCASLPALACQIQVRERQIGASQYHSGPFNDGTRFRLGENQT